MNENQEILSKMIEIVKNLPIGTNFSIGELIKRSNDAYDFSNFENTFNISKQFISECQKNINIENTQAGEMVGMPWSFIYVKK